MKIGQRSLLIAAAIALGSGGAAWWRHSEREATLRASVPPRPALAGFPADLAGQISSCEQVIQHGSAGVAALAELGQAYQANGFFPEAATCYRGLAQLESGNPRWPHRLACLYAGAGELESAVQLWRRTLSLAPDYVPARVRLGDALLKLNRPDEAESAYAAVLKSDAGNPYALVGLARLDVARKNLASARDRLEQAAAHTDDRIGADLLATVCEQLGDTARANALRARGKASGSFYDPPDPWMDEIFDDCYDVYRVTVAAGFADHAGNDAAARHLIDRALKLAPDNPAALYQSGSFALKARDYDRARRDFSACVQAAPDHSAAWTELINVCTEQHDAAGAARTLAAGLAHCPTSPTLHVLRAARLAADDRHAEAIAELEIALKLRPDDPEALVQLANAYFRTDRVPDGVAALHRALAAEPDHPAALTALAIFAIKTGDEPAAREWLRRSARQPRVPRDIAEALDAEFRQRFGHAPP